jgi:hypothetical protein
MCTTCGAAVQRWQHFCHACAAPLPPPTTPRPDWVFSYHHCPRCQTVINVGQPVCGYCGQRLDPASLAALPPTAMAARPVNRGNRNLAIVLLVLSLVVCGGLWWIIRSAPSLPSVPSSAGSAASASPEYQMATINANGYVAPSDPTVARFRYLLQNMATQCENTPQRMADSAVEAQNILRDKYGKPIRLLDLTEAINKSVSAGPPTTHCPDIIAALVVLTGQ